MQNKDIVWQKTGNGMVKHGKEKQQECILWIAHVSIKNVLNAQYAYTSPLQNMKQGMLSPILASFRILWDVQESINKKDVN